MIRVSSLLLFWLGVLALFLSCQNLGSRAPREAQAGVKRSTVFRKAVSISSTFDFYATDVKNNENNLYYSANLDSLEIEKPSYTIDIAGSSVTEAVYADGKVFITSFEPGFVAAIDDEKGRIIWKENLSPLPVQKLAITPYLLAVAIGRGNPEVNGRLYLYSPLTGEELNELSTNWLYEYFVQDEETLFAVGGPVAEVSAINLKDGTVRDRRVFGFSPAGVLLTQAGLMILGVNGELYFLEPKNLKLKQVVKTPAGYFSFPASDGSNLYYLVGNTSLSQQTKLACFSLAKLEERFEVPLSSIAPFSPVVAEDTIYVSTFFGEVLAISANDGAILWRARLGVPNRILAVFNDEILTWAFFVRRPEIRGFERFFVRAPSWMQEQEEIAYALIRLSKRDGTQIDLKKLPKPYEPRIITKRHLIVHAKPSRSEKGRLIAYPLKLSEIKSPARSSLYGGEK